MNFLIEEWFPVQILVADARNLLSDAKLMFDLTDFSQYDDERYANNKVTTYFKRKNLPAIKESDWPFFIKGLIDSVTCLAEKQGVDTKTNKIILQDLWLNRMWKNSSHSTHAHGGAIYSGTYYVNTPINCGSIRFSNPCENLWGLAMPPVRYGFPSTSMSINYDPNPGMLLIWNSWLYHEVLPSDFEGSRDSISFNFVIQSIL